MNRDRKISVCVTSFNRVDLTIRSFADIVDDDRVQEIVVYDDGSATAIRNQLREQLARIDKVMMYGNWENEGVYRAKKHAISLAISDWAILFDSDNRLDKTYLDVLYAIPEWDQSTSYLPSFAKPTFDYRHFGGRTINRTNVASMLGEKMFDCLINTMNGFYHRPTYWNLWEDGIEPLTSDSMYMNYLFLKADRSLYVVPGLEYEHLVHDGSHYKKHSHKNAAFRDELLNGYKRLR